MRLPWLAAVGFALAPLAFALPAAVTAVVLELGPQATRLITTGAIAASFLVALLVMNRAAPELRDFGWRRPENVGVALWFIPLAVAVGIVLVILLVDGTDHSPMDIGLGALLAIVVGLAEESWYRGIVFSVLRPLGVAVAVLGSAVLFSVVHAASILGGADLLATGLQLLFALLFGLVAALVAWRTGSLWPGIVWHAAHNTVSFASTDALTPAFIGGYSLVGVALVGYVWWLSTRGRSPSRT